MADSSSDESRPVSGTVLFFPLVVGLVHPSPLPPGVSGPAEPDRLFLFNPFSQTLHFSSDELLLRMVQQMSMAEEKSGPSPASKASIAEMRAVEASDGECVICLDELRKEVKEMPCEHRFHGECIETWLKMHGSCPVCRFQMPEEEEEEEEVKEVADDDRRISFTITFSSGEETRH